MTLRKLKIITMVLPVAGVIVLEIVRYLIVGWMSWEKRLALDLILVGAIVVFSIVIFRFVSETQERLTRQNRELLALHDAALDVTAQLSLEVVLNRVVEQARLLVDARYGALSVIGKDQQIVSFITSGITAEERGRLGDPPVGHGLLGVVLRQGKHIRTADLSKDPRAYGFPPGHPPMRSLLAVPIPCKGPFLGNLYLTEKSAGREFTPDDEQTLSRFALQAALAIDNAYLHEQVESLAIAQERLRIAHEMHDGLAQVLGYVNTKVQAAEAYLKRDKMDEAGAQLRELTVAARQAYSDVRESIVGLRSLPSEASFSTLLQEYTSRWEEMSGVNVELEIEPELRIRPSQELQIVRIVQESLTNVRKHAKATHARVEVARHGSMLVVTITDDGVGFHADARSRGEFPQFGLSTMRERAESIGGKLTIDSVPGAGTTVRLELKLMEGAA